MNERSTYRQADRSIDERVADLLGRMTIEEKRDQLIQGLIGSDDNVNNVGTGSFCPTYGAVLGFSGSLAERNDYQRIAVEETRLGIPIIWGYDVIHGCDTCLPIPLAQAASFNPDLAEKGARIAALESRAHGIDWTFSPMVDVARDPRWGRIAEGYGEDVHMNAVFGAAAVRGYQGDDLAAEGSIAACAKHFVGYGYCEGGRDYHYTDLSARTLWETCLPPFKGCVDAGAATLMSAFNDVTGTPAVVNRYTMTGVLREKWGFRGFVVSDYSAISQLEAQGFSKDPGLQARAALGAGNDMDMVSCVYEHIPTLVEQGQLGIDVVDEAVSRVLRIKFELGLFEHPYASEADGVASRDGAALVEDAAAESMVLLKNEGVLPLNPGIKQVALIGPLADDPKTPLGTWTAFCSQDRTVTIEAGLRDRLSGDVELNTCRGCDFLGSDTAGFAEAVGLAKDADIAILAVGEPVDYSGEANYVTDLRLTGVQEALIETISETGTPIVLVVSSGRPLVLARVEPVVQSIIMFWQPGHSGGAALADLLLGRRNFSGKLPVTVPRATGQIPIYYCTHSPARDDYLDGNGQETRQHSYKDCPNTPHYEFGFGLGYSTFEYSGLELSHATITPEEVMTCKVRVTNTGETIGKETVLWYISDPEATITQPRKRLIGFEQVRLEPGESRQVAFRIVPDEHLSYPDAQGNRLLEGGAFVLSLQSGARAEFTLCTSPHASARRRT